MRLSPRNTLILIVVCAAIPNLSHAAFQKFKFKVAAGRSIASAAAISKNSLQK